MPPQTLLVVGAGPKALALAAKVVALRTAGAKDVPQLIVVEEREVAANWTGTGSGFTDGTPLLASLPEKDVGFPYRSAEWGKLNRKVDDAMRAFSWGRFLVLNERPNMSFRDWMDRGRPQPTHREFADYLQWVAEEVSLKEFIRYGTVRSIKRNDGKWVITYVYGDNEESSEIVDDLVVTGPGVPAKPPTALNNNPKYLNAVTFWNNVDQFAGKDYLDICVIGAGETSAAIVVALLDRVSKSRIVIITPSAFIFSRGENYLENKVSSDPRGWDAYTLIHRREFIRRTDQGVFSQEAQQKISSARDNRVEPFAGRATNHRPYEDYIVVDIAYEGAQYPVTREYDIVIDGANLNLLWFTQLMDRPTHKEFTKVLLDQLERAHVEQPKEQFINELLEDARKDLARNRIRTDYIMPLIDRDLSLRGHTPAIHLPMLAGLKQGPGFTGLGCLGLLSDRILKPYVAI